MSRHTIRLRNPWKWNEHTGDAAAARLVAHRPFNRPTGLDSGTRVILVIADIAVLAAVQINDQPLITPRQEPEIAQQQWDITSLLKPRNQLQLVYHASATAGDTEVLRQQLDAGSVRLEMVTAGDSDR